MFFCIFIEVLCVGNLYNPDVRYSFNVPVEEKNNPFTWDPHGPWQDCTRMCQGTLLSKTPKFVHAGIIGVVFSLASTVWQHSPHCPHTCVPHTLHSFPVLFPLPLLPTHSFPFLYLTASFIFTHFNILHCSFFPFFSHFLSHSHRKCL